MKSIAVKFILKLFAYIRAFLNKIDLIKLKNRDFTIISSNCVGGVIYHDLGMKFLTPTINLNFKSLQDFIFYVQNIEDFQNAELIEITDSEYDFPVGRLLSNSGKSVVINFMHYKSFEEAKRKWFERSNRINFENLYVIIECRFKLDEATANMINDIKFKKRILTSPINENLIDDVCILDIYDENYAPGKSLVYPHFYSLRRYFYKMNYIKFFNS